MSIACCGCKIQKASFKDGVYTFNLLGYGSTKYNGRGIIKINDAHQECNLDSATKQEVFFAPICDRVRPWKLSVSVPEHFINDYENILVVETIETTYPVCAWFKSTPNNLIIPPIDNIKRVSGKYANHVTYRNEGRTEYLRYKKIIGEYYINTRKASTIGSLLDWGVGCGRVAQHFANEKEYRVCGLDIDKVNLDWCSKNLPALHCTHAELDPPTELPDQEFDLIISSSVLSHLTPGNWLKWVNEMCRLLKDDGIALLSFHGDHSNSVMLFNRPDALINLSKCGFVDLSASFDLGGELSYYYRNVFYTDSYARQLFARNFTILDCVPGIVSGSQTVAVLKKTT
jgi:SAM-dependent methyltransferase